MLRAVRPKFLEIQGLAASALDANVSIGVSHLGAAQKIKPLAAEILLGASVRCVIWTVWSRISTEGTTRLAYARRSRHLRHLL